LKNVFVRREIPRVRRLGHIPQLSDFERGRIVGLRKAGLSVREIAKRTGRFVRTILRYHQAWTQEGREYTARDTGRHRMTTSNKLFVIKSKFSEKMGSLVILFLINLRI
jgi:IS30 family transposase